MAPWKLTIRHGPDVDRQGYEDLDAAIAAAEDLAARICSEGRLSDVSFLREFKPADQVHARLEISGRGLLRAPTAGVDLRGDGSVVPYRGAMRRVELKPGARESPFDVVRAALEGRR